MDRTIARISVGAVIVSCLITACGSGDGTGTGAPAGPDITPSSGDAAQQVTASIEQTSRQSPITFEPEKAELTAPATQALGQIAKALQGNDVRISVFTHAGYPDAEKATTLSEKRAEVITSALERLGVSKERVAQDATGNQKARGDQALNTQISVAP